MQLINLPMWVPTISSLLTLTTAGKVTNPSRVPKNAVLLSKVPTLTLRAGKYTASRRVDAVPQLDCIGPKDVCKLYQVDVMRCANEGADYDAENIQWSCKASLPEEFKLGSTDVVCEGYESSDDPYVLKGSCGVEYRLLLTSIGEQKYGRARYQGNWEKPNVNISFGQGSRSAGTVFFIIFAIVLFIIVRGIWSSWNRNPPRLGGGRLGGGGGGGGTDDGNDPPPPYDNPPPYYNQPRKSKTPSTGPRSYVAPSSRASSSRSAPQAQGWRPGFWTGTAAGAAAGYFAGSRNTRVTNTEQREAPREPEVQQRPGGFFSGFRNTQRSSQPSSFTAPSFSTTRHESAGFGETRRR